MGEKLGGDTTWRDHMRSEILRTEVEICTVLGERDMRLADIKSLKVGQTIALDVTPDDPFEVTCGGVPLARAQIGRQRNNVAIGIVSTIAQGQSR
jgi:flagellar motor switch protein FliM